MRRHIHLIHCFIGNGAVMYLRCNLLDASFSDGLGGSLNGHGGLDGHALILR